MISIRKLTPYDFNAIRPIYSDPGVTYPAAFAPIEDDMLLARALLVLMKMEQDVIEQDGVLVGMIDHTEEQYEPGERAVSIGYMIAREYWGKGICTQAVRLYTQQLFAQGYDSIYADCFLDNPASARVLEKAGFVYQHDFEKKFSCFEEVRTLHLYKLTRDTAQA